MKISKLSVNIVKSEIASQAIGIAVSSDGAVAKELGDIAWYLAVLAFELDYTLEEIMQMNLDKLASRQQRGVLSGSGDSR